METKMAVTPSDLASLKADMVDMKALMQRVADAMIKLALLDDRQQGMSDVNREILRRLSSMEDRQHAADLVAAGTSDSASRLSGLETGFREMHLDRERDKARIQTVTWTIRLLWMVIPGCMVAAVWLSKLAGA